MLFKDNKIILPATLELLESIQADVYFSDFFLVGGTVLALQIGHRQSIDLDFFRLTPFAVEETQTNLADQYGFYTDKLGKNTLIGFIGNVKVELITHAGKLVNPLLETENLRMASMKDIAAMKLNAISQSGQRWKDFFDVYCLLEIIPLRTMIEFYETKYPQSNPLIPLKALTYFEDIDFEMDKPIMLKKVSTNKVKKRILDAVQKPDIIF